MDKVTIIAEIGVNHNGNMDLAIQLIDSAIDAGADAVKFQTYLTHQLATLTAPKAAYQKKNTETEKDESQYDMLKRLELSKQDHVHLQHYCKNKIKFLSSPFDIESADFLINTLKLSCIKIPSGEITNAPLLLQIARSKIEIILSTGMSTLGEIEDALGVLAFGYLESTEKPTLNAFRKAYATQQGQSHLQKHVTILHCTSAYPTSFDHVNLFAMDTLRSAFGLSVGYSDHTQGIAIPIAAVARGATVIEKHFTLDTSLPGPDHKASLEPAAFKQMVNGIRSVIAALGSFVKKPVMEESDTKNVARKSLIAAKPIKLGEIFTEKNIIIQRPGTGVSPMFYWDYLLKRAAQKNYQTGELIHE